MDKCVKKLPQIYLREFFYNVSEFVIPLRWSMLLPRVLFF